MKPKTTLYLFVALVVLALVYYFWGVKGAAEREIQQERASKLLPISPDSVDQVTIFHEGDSILVYQRQPDGWRITYPVNTGADQKKIKTNLDAYLDAKKDRTIAEEFTNLQPYGLDHPQAKIEITYNDTGKAALLIGDENPTGSSVFVKRGSKPPIYTSGKKLLTEGNKGLFDLRDRSILHFNEDAISRIVIDQQNGQEIQMSKFGNDWRLHNPDVPGNSSQIRTVLNKLSNGNVTEVTEEQPNNLSEYGLDNPQATISLFSNDSTKAAVLAVGKPVNPENKQPNYYAKDLSRPQVFKINHSTAENLLKGPYDFQDKQLFHMTSSQVSDITIQWADSTFELTKIDSVWKITKPIQAEAVYQNADQIAVQLPRLRLDGLESYSPKPMSAYGLNNPWLKVQFKVSGSEFDGFIVGNSAGDNMRYITLDSMPYVYKIKESKLKKFQVNIDELKKVTPASLKKVSSDNK